MRRPRKAPKLDPTVPCDIWTGAVSSNGYGNLSRGGRNLTSHAAAWNDAVGPVPAGHDLHHTCETKLCREVRHLALLTRAEHRALHAAQRTHCDRGHARTPENLYSHEGVLRCRPCRTESTRARRAA